MRVKQSRFFLIAALGTVLSFPACAGFIYDDDLPLEEDDQYTYVAKGNHFDMVNASIYTAWVYVDLEEGVAVRVNEYGDEEMGEEPANWHFAMHRFDCKTNGAEVLETQFSSINQLVTSGLIPKGTFQSDVWTDDKVAYDMTNMMEGDILYAESYYNPELSRWVYFDINIMPPVYTPSNKVYLIRFEDGKLAALRFTGYRSPSSGTGFVSFDYVYPFEF